MSEQPTRVLKRLLGTASSEVSLCDIISPPANNLTKFDIVKSSEKEDVKKMWTEITADKAYTGFIDGLDSYLENSINNAVYRTFQESLDCAIWDIQYSEMTKEEKAVKFQEVFNQFVEEYKNSPITKNQEDELVVKVNSPTNPLNPKEVVEKMENKMEKTNIFAEAMETLKSAMGFQKEMKELIVGEVAVVKAEVKEVPVEKTAEKVDVVAEDVTKAIQTELEEVKKAKADAELELAEIKKAQAEQAIAVEKASFIAKAKEEFEALVGTNEEIGEKLYEISKSALSDEMKTFVLDNLKKVSKSNEEKLNPIGKTVVEGKSAKEEFEALKEQIAKDQKISVVKAHSIAKEQDIELYNKVRSEEKQG